ncbi:MAG: hypothetical protein IT292_05440 [Deltaproteobacteria bacterium]|nr:hypothetical protein [Deltaproteobacteria bacterium]
MSLEYLEDLISAIDSGREYFACQGQNTHQWYISTSVDALREKAQRAANFKRYAIKIYRMSNGSTGTATVESYLVAKKIIPTSTSADPHMEWVLVDTRQAAEVVRDISFGPSPFFGLIEEEVLRPQKQEIK